MPRRSLCLIVIYYALQISSLAYAQPFDKTSFSLYPRLSFYSFEKQGEMLLHVPSSATGQYFNISLMNGSNLIAEWHGMAVKKILRIPFSIDSLKASEIVEARITAAGGKKYSASCDVPVLTYKPNEVKTDRLTGGLIVDKRVFFPFGFFSLPEEEVVRGFNMISPYQKILPETLGERKAYMDRCAELGMKVHYNLLSVAGGGGVSSKIESITEEEKRLRLIDEINAFKDHPALLAWYISDEPNGYRIPPEYLEEVYLTIKETDPWHPVSMVFMAPFLASRRYAGAMDIVMADPYPVPDRSVVFAGNVAASLRREFEGKKPVWMVPQAFGGGELWNREPTIQEIRSMTYQSVINGARGIQFFVREGLNLFPKSVAMWNECGRMALEIAEMAPWLLSGEETITVTSDSPDIQVLSAMKNGQLLVLAVNRVNAPLKAGIRVSGGFNGKADLIFENRKISVNSGLISDHIPAFGSQAYLIKIRKETDPVKPYRGNLVKDPGFESSPSPGVPASCYAWNNGDRGATYFLDTREHYEGDHSLRLTTPVDNKSVRLRFFPVEIIKGRTYFISVRVKATARIIQKSSGSAGKNEPWISNTKMPWFEMGLGEYGKARFTPDNDWKEFITSVTIPLDEEIPQKANVILQMPGEGVAWFDMLQVFEAVYLKRSINPEIRLNQYEYHH